MTINKENKEELGIYIHIPFCKQKCYYCDFISFCNKDYLIKEYVQAIKIEIQNKIKNIDKTKYNITTIYIGGGTPSYIDAKYIEEILNELKNEIQLAKEITIEVNPGTVTKEKLEKYKGLGINRLSIGLQETHNNLLKQIGRIHTLEEFKKTYEMAKIIGFENVNIDLMLGLPNQTIKDLKENLSYIVKLNPNHISVYSLILEEGTNLYKQVENNSLQLPTEEQERNMYWYVKSALELNGYKHYEISNFSKPNYESKHNINCWEQKEYIGFGVAAHSYFEGKRFSNTENIEEYINNIQNNNLTNNIKVHEIQNIEDMQKEYMLLNLRKIEGVNIQKFKNKFKCNPIFLYKEELNKLTKEDLLTIDGNYIRLTNKGIDLANLVWENFV